MSKKDENSLISKYNLKWVITISIWTFITACFLNAITEGLVKNLDIFLSFILLGTIIFIGVFFDIIGIAVTSAEETPFHSMAANRVMEAKYAIKLVRNAGQVSNFCNDVIGDISGILSGALGTNIIYKLGTIYDLRDTIVLSVIVTSLIASLTVGGKAFGKSIAIRCSDDIIFKVAKILYFINKKTGIDLIGCKKKRN
jgi:CBS domain containing-hemolysin-like protein